MLFNLAKTNKDVFATPNSSLNELEEAWLSEGLTEGQLMVDVYSTDKHIVVKSAMAGVKPEDLNIALNNDLLTIRGKREAEKVLKEHNYLYKECYFGSFSRSLVLPAEVDNKKIEAYLENGVLTVVLNKLNKQSRIKILVKE